MRRAVMTTLVGLVLSLAVSTPAAAQFIQAGAGYTVLHESLDDERFWDHGFRADLFFPFMTVGAGDLGAVGEFTLNRNSEFADNLMGFLGGVRLTFGRRIDLEPFAQVLIGGERCCDPGSTGLAVQFGGGVTKWWGTFGIRGQADFRRSRYSDDLRSESYNEPILGVIAVIRLGGS